MLWDAMDATDVPEGALRPGNDIGGEMTTEEIQAKITKLDDKIWPAMSESQKPLVLAAHAQERAAYEVAAQLSRIGDLLFKFFKDRPGEWR